MINLCLVVIATQFSETKKREMERMRQERARYTSTSTLASSTNNSEPATCYAEIVKYIAHLWRRFKRRMLKKYRLYKYAACPFLFSSFNSFISFSFNNYYLLYIYIYQQVSCLFVCIFLTHCKKKKKSLAPQKKKEIELIQHFTTLQLPKQTAAASRTLYILTISSA